jgi:hypothetical protein
VIDDPADEHGRGMLLVRGLSIRTGVCGDRRGHLVWADVPWGRAEPALPQDQYEAAIDNIQDDLVSRFTGVLTWFGRSTMQWWALIGTELIAAPSVEELARLLAQILDLAPPVPHRPWDAVGAARARGPCLGR